MSKFVPAMFIAVPADPITGLKLVIVGALSPAPTKKLVTLLALPAAELTLIGPEVTPVGAFTTKRLAVADNTGELNPLNVTVFNAGVVPKPEPVIVISVPDTPVSGAKSIMAVALALKRLIEAIFPTGS